MILVGIMAVDIVLLGVLSVYEGAREEAELTVHVENPLDIEGVRELHHSIHVH